MIAGETEALFLNYTQDSKSIDTIFNTPRKTRRKRRQKKSRFLEDLGTIYDELGKAEGIGKVIDAITKPNDQKPKKKPIPKDYQVNVGSLPTPLKDTQKGIPKIIYVLATIVIIGGTGLVLAKQYQNKKK